MGRDWFSSGVFAFSPWRMNGDAQPVQVALGCTQPLRSALGHRHIGWLGRWSEDWCSSRVPSSATERTGLRWRGCGFVGASGTWDRDWQFSDVVQLLHISLISPGRQRKFQSSGKKTGRWYGPKPLQDSPRLPKTSRNFPWLVFAAATKSRKATWAGVFCILKCGFTLSYPYNYESWNVRETPKHLESEVLVVPLSRFNKYILINHAFQSYFQWYILRSADSESKRAPPAAVAVALLRARGCSAIRRSTLLALRPAGRLNTT